jgi:hypothetical protein
MQHVFSFYCSQRLNGLLALNCKQTSLSHKSTVLQLATEPDSRGLVPSHLKLVSSLKYDFWPGFVGKHNSALPDHFLYPHHILVVGFECS